MVRSHIEVNITMSLDEALALESRLASHTHPEPETVKALRVALSRELGNGLAKLKGVAA